MPNSVNTVAYDVMRSLLIQERKRAGLSQQEVASRLGLPQSFVSKYERGERRLDVVELVDVCVAIGTDVGQLVNALEKEMRKGAEQR